MKEIFAAQPLKSKWENMVINSKDMKKNKVSTSKENTLMLSGYVRIYTLWLVHRVCLNVHILISFSLQGSELVF